MADSLRQSFGLEAQLVKGASGAFDVELDGDLIFSKYQRGRFPAPDEVEAIVRQRLTG